MLWDEHYHDDKALVLDLCDIMNAEFKELAAAGLPGDPVEEPRHHGLTNLADCKDADLEFQTEAFNRQLTGVTPRSGCIAAGANPNQQRVYWDVPSYERAPAASAAAELRRHHLRMRQASSDGKDLPLFAKYKTTRRSASASSVTRTPSSSRPSMLPT